MQLDDSIKTLAGIGPNSVEKLNNLGIETIGNLLFHYPTYYKDSSNVGSLSTLDKLNKRTVTATLTQLKNVRLRNGKFLQKGLLTDGEAELDVVWFNQPYLTKNLKPPVELVLSGKLNPKQNKPQFMSPEYEIVSSDHEKSLHLGNIVPVYKLTKGITPKWIRNKINYLVKNIDLINDLDESLSQEIRDKYKLIEKIEAIKLIHFPQSTDDIVKARKRLGFDELLGIQEKLLKNRKALEKQPAHQAKVIEDELTKIINTLPFSLTNSQKTAIAEIHEDISKPHPMRRLLQGDVGSGKTIVALLALLPFIAMGKQVVLLAPTSILAGQHFDSANKLLGEKYNIGLVTSATKERSSKLDLIIGTHAVLANKDLLIKDLAMVIIDEQHRFGVKQRQELAKLTQSTIKPHILQLTATPIPRTVALTLFGDYKVSRIDPPKTRKVVKTHLVPETKRTDSYAWIKSIVDEGGQVFWILPAIEEQSELKSLSTFFPSLKKEFKTYKLSELHGKVSGKKKDEILVKFSKGKTEILVATTVVEVGIDIPGANLIVIESAERFGLAQLHQLRGRVGRNNQESWCLLYYNESNDQVKRRLEYFAKEHDGIKIAKFDLQRRGPGEVYGDIQSGIPNLKIAKFSNLELLDLSRKAALELYK